MCEKQLEKTDNAGDEEKKEKKTGGENKKRMEPLETREADEIMYAVQLLRKKTAIQQLPVLKTTIIYSNFKGGRL